MSRIRKPLATFTLKGRTYTVGLNPDGLIGMVAAMTAFSAMVSLWPKSHFLAIVVAFILMVPAWFRPKKGYRTTLKASAEASARMLTWMAGSIVGKRRAYLREAWAADLGGDPAADVTPPLRRRLLLAAGFVVAAFRLRLDDLAELAWRPADALVSSWHGSNLSVLLPVTIAVGLILSREGFYGLIANAENLGIIAAAPYAAIKGIRHYRQIDTPKRPEKSSDEGQSADGTGQRPQ